jgi:hypothetical protein
MRRRMAHLIIVGLLAGGAVGMVRAAADPSPDIPSDKIALLDCEGNVVGYRVASRDVDLDQPYTPPQPPGSDCRVPTVEVQYGPGVPATAPPSTASPSAPAP